MSIKLFLRKVKKNLAFHIYQYFSQPPLQTSRILVYLNKSFAILNHALCPSTLLHLTDESQNTRKCAVSCLSYRKRILTKNIIFSYFVFFIFYFDEVKTTVEIINYRVGFPLCHTTSFVNIMYLNSFNYNNIIGLFSCHIYIRKVQEQISFGSSLKLFQTY